VFESPSLERPPGGPEPDNSPVPNPDPNPVPSTPPVRDSFGPNSGG
jgi:hypothetical protein